MSDHDFDTSDVDRWIGVPLGGGVLKDAIGTNDIRRWAQGMQNPQPLHFDDAFAAESRHGAIIAPQSFAVCTDDSHGAGPAIQGSIPGTHMLFGGDEWWFFGPRILVGDRFRHERMLFDYKVTENKFAGPTMFSRGDTTYVNDRGELVCKQRSTSIRYRADLARERGQFMGDSEKTWTEDDLYEVEKQKFEYYQSYLDLGHGRRLFVNAGDKLPKRPIGPHTLMSFTTEWRAFLQNLWGAFGFSGGPSSLWNAGWLPEMDRDHEGAKVDPTYADGLYHGPSRGHVQEKYAQLIGLPRGYGYGASMGAWIIDYLANWAGEWGEIVHSKMSYRSPAFTGDLTYLDGVVTAIAEEPETGQPMASVDVTMTNHKGDVMANGTAEVRLPSEDRPAA